MPVKRNALRVLRAGRDISQYEAGKAVGISPNRFFRIENGQTEPTKEELDKLAAFFRVKVREFWAEEAA